MLTRLKPVLTRLKPALTAMASVLALDRTGLRPAAAAKAAVGVLIPIVVGVAISQPAAGAAASFGALSAGVAMITAGPRTPIYTMIAVSVGMARGTSASTESGSIISHPK